MKELIEALQILLKYGNPTHPTHCEHDELAVLIDPAIVSESDKEKLEEMGFHAFYADEEDSYFISFRYGSA